MTKECPVKQATTKLGKHLWLSWGEAFKQDGLFKDLLTKKITMLDVNAKKIFDAREAISEYIKTNDLAAHFKEKLNVVTGKNLSNEMAGKPTLPLADYVTGIPDEVRTALADLEEIYKANGYKINKILHQTDKWKTFFSDMAGSMKQEIISVLPPEPEGVKQTVKGFIADEAMGMYGMGENTARRFAEDMIGDELGSGKRYTLVSNLKQVYRFLKYAPPFGILGGTLLLNNNSLVGGVRYYAEKAGVKKIFNSEAIDLLLNDGVLGSVNKAADINLQAYLGEGQTYFNRVMDYLVNKVPLLSPEKRANLEAVMKGGIHAVWDMGMEDSIKRLSLSKALAKRGINENTIAQFIKDYKEGKISKEFVDGVRTDAYLFNRDWYTNASLAVLSRHRASRRWIFNTMQSYAIIRTDEMVSSLRRFSDDLSSGKLKSMGDFLDYINTENMELKSMIMATLHAAKFGYYVDLITGNKEDNNKNYKDYILGMNDYFTAMETSFFYRILTAPLEGIKGYMQLQNMKGEPENMLEGIQVAALKTLTTTIQSMFREGLFLKRGLDGALSYAKTGDLDFTKEIMATDWDKITSGVGRFMLMPGLETYGLSNIKQRDDFFNFLTMSYQETNKSVKEVSKLRNVSDIEQILNDSSGYLRRLIGYLPVIGGALNSQYGGKSETLYKMINKLRAEDPVFEGIFNGEMPMSLLEDPELTSKLKYEIENFDYTNLTYEGMGKHVQSYASNKLREDVFVPNIAEEVFGSVENMHAALISNGISKKLGLVKMLAAAEAEVPGSSRIVLSYLAKQDEAAIKARIAGNQYANKAEMTLEQQAAIDKELVAKRYPYMYAADKGSWYGIAQKYLDKVNPDIRGTVARDYDIKNLTNTLAFMDLLVQDAGNKGDVDANYIKNIFAITAKFTKDPAARMAIVNNTLGSIGALNAPASVKSAMRVGVLAGNIDFYNKIKQDETASVLYEEELNGFEDTVWGTLENINNVGNDLLLNNVSSGFKSNYYSNTGRSYSPSSYSKGNAKTYDTLTDKAQKYYSPAQSTRTNVNSRSATTPYYPIEILEPKRYKTYAKVYEQTIQAKSANIVGVKGKQYPAEFIAGLKFQTPGYTKALISAAKPKVFKKPKTKYISKSVLRNLPGG